MNNPQNYWASSPYPHPVAYPKWKFHATEPARQVSSPEQEAALGEGWSDVYIKKDYPKTKFKLKADPKPGEPHYETRVVDTPEDEGKLEGGWGDTLPTAPKVKAESSDQQPEVKKPAK